MPPRRVGGNMDIREPGRRHRALAAGRRVAGGLLSVRRHHMPPRAMAKCAVPAIESPKMSVALKFELEKGAAPNFPRFRTAGPVTRHLDERRLRRDHRDRPRS